LLLEMLKEKINDQRLIRYLARMFKAGVLADGDLSVSEEGVPQGSVRSPILANVFAYYVIDDWFDTVVKAQCAGRVEMFRYCDGLVVCC
jgi:retron-type reverse transcriptase